MARRHWIVLGAVLLVAAPLVGLAIVDFHESPNGSWLHVDEPVDDVPANETITFQSLSPDQRRVFERAVRSDRGYTSIPKAVNETVWIDARAVRYENETYPVGVAVS
ncbi:hypothetical protein ACFQMA_03020 [Halosimplex aquaticum]|uniref:DUF7979 domain-containing protein n=1 Tax=Halosimplex aquaticum TaxID=3026162 RepID=A0ABD5XZ24_9EURY|nr:hypothetical protein [Halosimplex aquaticum]